MPNLPHAGHGSNPPWAKKHLASRRNSGYNVKLYKIIKFHAAAVAGKGVQEK